jgi:acetolactate synthase, large subunit (EC 2.2.1.6)
MNAQPKSHPLAGHQMNGADIIVQVLVDEGVDVVFGYSGGAILPTYDAVFRYNQEHPGQRQAGVSARPCR